LLQQLTIGGRCVLPHGDAYHQQLARITRRDDKTFVEEDLGDVRFVPLLGWEGWPVSRTSGSTKWDRTRGVRLSGSWATS
jgi:protein-L-isoaspartate O-methyltransferase